MVNLKGGFLLVSAFFHTGFDQRLINNILSKTKWKWLEVEMNSLDLRRNLLAHGVVKLRLLMASNAAKTFAT